ncbi:MAG: DUF402 domain-containing protein [Spirochaetaceae bacterium]|nr:MAG: DUF402 domain-containing protein [Spirochaetaceae bacterium]
MHGTYTVYKLDHTGREKLHYPAELLARNTVQGHIAVSAVFALDSADGGAFELTKGDRMVEHFFEDRYYNVFEVSSPDGTLKGYYCNITRPAVLTDTEIRADDLALDISVNPAGEYMILDKDEFDELPIPDHERTVALSAAETLLALIQEASWPFERLRAS